MNSHAVKEFLRQVKSTRKTHWFVISITSNYEIFVLTYTEWEWWIFFALRAFHTFRISSAYPLFVVKLDNSLSSLALRRWIRKENNSAISRGCNTCALTQSAVSQGLCVFGSARVCAEENVCVYVDAANLYTASQHIYTARLHVLLREFSSVGCTTMGDSFISSAPTLPTGWGWVDERCQGAVVAVDELLSN